MQGPAKRISRPSPRRVFVGTREPIATWPSSIADTCEPSDVVAQGVAYIVEPNRVCQLRVEQCHHVAPRTECACHCLYSGFSRKLRHHVARDLIAKLHEDRELASSWSWSPGFSFVHTRALSLPGKPVSSSRFFFYAVGCLCLRSNERKMQSMNANAVSLPAVLVVGKPTICLNTVAEDDEIGKRRR